MPILREIKNALTNTILDNLGKRTSLFMILAFTSITIIDSTFLEFSSYSDVPPSVSSNVLIFTSLFLVSALISIILINTVNKITASIQRLPSSIFYFKRIIYCTQILTFSFILIVLLQIVLFQKYSVNLLHASTILTHLSTLAILVVLIILFMTWLKSRKNIMVSLYIISFSLISLSILVSLIYLEYQYSYQTSRTMSLDRKPYSFFSVLANQVSTPSSQLLNMTFEIIYLLAFLSTWVATLKMLYQYRYKIGKIKYFILLGVPLMYYLFTFQDYFGNLFSSLVLNYPLAFGLVYAIIFSATKQVGALLFALAFWTASSQVASERVFKSLLISAIGIAILFGSIEITTLQYRFYPPFGLVTEAFMPLGAYLLLMGLYTSATSVARDTKLRKEFYSSAMSQLTLLRSIGVTQMEKELMKNFKSIEKHTVKLEATEEHYSEEDVKQIVREVLEELKRNDLDKARKQP